MTSRPYTAILDEIAKRRGLTLSNVDSKDLGTMITGLNAAMDYAWSYGTYGWPEACSVRKFARELQDETEYTFLSYTPADNVSIEGVLGITREDPRVNLETTSVPYRRGEDGLYFPEGGGAADVWVRWRKPAPVFTDSVHDASREYPAETVVWNSPAGECYRALQTVPATTLITSAAHWQPQLIPARLAQALIAGAHAVSVMAEAQYNTAAILAKVMDGHLETKLLQLIDESR